jgi:hypothetical protein
LTEVRVNGRDVPPEDMVMLLAEMVKLGVGAGAFAAQRFGASASRTGRQVRALFLVIMETSRCFSQQQ